VSGDVRVLIVDDHPIVRKGLREVLEEAPGFTVVGECGDGDAALAAIASMRPHVVVLDVDMPKRDGFSVVRALANEPSKPEFVLMTMHGREDFLRTAFDLGVKAYVVKEGAMLDVVDAIQAVLAGRPYISSELSASLLTLQGGAEAERPLEGLSRLTPAEKRVLRLIAEFKTSKEIAQELDIHYRTVENHRTSIAGKLGLSGSHALTKFAVAHRDRLA
jgi:DNA-binding NarL/FixJ family response regulator